MIEPDPPARIPLLRPDQFDDAVRAYLDKWTGGFTDPTKNHPLLTFAHHTKLADRFSRFNMHLLTTSTVPVKQRQIAIMRTAWICKAVYIWSSHLRTSIEYKLDPAMFEPIKRGAGDPYFSEFERAIIRATDELVAERNLSDENWQALAAQWTNQQLLDFLFTAGCYVMLAGVMGAARVAREPELLELASRYGAPVRGSPPVDERIES